MRKLLATLTALAIVLGVSWQLAQAQDDAKPKFTIKEVMKKAHQGGLMKRVASGKGTDEDVKELVAMYDALGKNTPPKGDDKSWKEKTKVLLEAAKAVEEKKEGAGPALAKAANCKECHSAHRES